MTEHKMTAEEKSDTFHKFCHEKGYPRNEKSIGEMAYEFAGQFALQVATEAVEEEKKEAANIGVMSGWEYFRFKSHLDSILKNIKKRLNNE